MRKLGFIWLTIMALLTGCASNEAASVGIIGGASGPTAIFVAGRVNTLIMMALVGILLVVGIIIFCIVRRK